MAPLDRALALAEVQQTAAPVAEHLHLHVARPLEELLEIDPGIAERRLRLATRGGQRIRQLLRARHGAHALAAAAARRFHEHRIAQGAGAAAGLRDVARAHLGAGHQWHAGAIGGGARGDLVAHGGDGLGRRPDPGEPGVHDGAREAGVLGEEAVAGMDGVGPRVPCRLDEGIHAEIRLPGRRGSDADGVVGGEDVRRLAVRVGVDRHGGEPLGVAGAGDADGDLAAVGDQHAPHGHMRKTPQVVRGTGACSAAASVSPSASRVSSGSRMPSSHSRAVA